MRHRIDLFWSTPRHRQPFPVLRSNPVEHLKVRSTGCGNIGGNPYNRVRELYIALKALVDVSVHLLTVLAGAAIGKRGTCTQHHGAPCGVSCCSKRPDICRATRCERGELMAQALRFLRPCPLTSVAQAIVAGFVHEGGDGASPRGCR